ncbi:MAG: glycoside hydrolase family 95 protein [Bacteroidales bacterium]|jgi:alpha-L-fucosidase 2|nr:glycoside hydrolase family 95 protein [Bacteroidales bacterium]
MKKLILAFLFAASTHVAISAQSDNSTRLWYEKPASRFEEALPLGNGRIGLMVYGDVYKETFHLNEETLWGGGPANTSAPPNTVENLEKVRELLFQEKWSDASRVLRNIQGANSQSFVPMGDIFIEQFYNSQSTPRNYVRDLDLTTAIATTSYVVDTVNYRREIFVSAPDQIAVIKLSTSKKGELNFSISGNTPFDGATVKSIGNNEFYLSGQLPVDINSAGNFLLKYGDEKGQKGMRYQYRIKVLSDGFVSTHPFIRVNRATEATVLLSAATSFNGFDKRPDTEGKDENETVEKHLKKAMATPYEQLRQNHINDYQSYYNRLHLDIGGSSSANKPTDERLKDYTNGGDDVDLERLYFNFGRYLMISSSRPGGIPANLQGIWNKNQRPPWGSNYTVNINLQMNYWAAGMLNLNDLNEPLITQIRNMSVTGTQIAKNYYNLDGWTTHHNSDIWAHANPVGHQSGDPKWANWSLGSPWLSQHLYDYYRFSGDKNFLAETAYPLMKSAADFCLEWLVEKDGWLLTAPSTSPENVFIDDNGNNGVVTIASTMDMEIIWDLFTNLIEASEILRADNDKRQKWTEARKKLYPLRIGKEGNLIEWYKDWKDADPEHRHVSHLFGLHPGRQISPVLTPEFAQAAKKTLEVRGDGGTGWSKAWKVNFHARLLNGEHAYKMYRELLSKSTLPNLFDTHPPFQIDGNFGGISGVGEMLLQSHLNEIHLLPAIPQKWETGEVAGICARGAFEINMKWTKNKLISADITSKAGNECTLRTDVPLKIKGASAKTKKEGAYYVTSFKTQKDKIYHVEAK